MARKKKAVLQDAPVAEETKVTVEEVKPEVEELGLNPIAVAGKASGEKELKSDEIAFECVIAGGFIFSRTCVEQGEALIFKKSDDRLIVKNLMAKKHLMTEIKDLEAKKFYRF